MSVDLVHPGSQRPTIRWSDPWLDSVINRNILEIVKDHHLSKLP